VALMSRRIGLLLGRAARLTSELSCRLGGQPAIQVESLCIGASTERHIGRYDLVLDLASQRVPHYRHHLRAAALAGVSVIHDPFGPDLSDRFFSLGVAARLGLPTVRAALLPQHAYGERLDEALDLGNLRCPLRWQAVADYVGLPAVLVPADGSPVEPCAVADLQALWRAYDRTGQAVMMLRQYLEASEYLRVFTVASDHATAVRIDRSGRVAAADGGDGQCVEPRWQRARDDALKLAGALGCELGAVDFALTARGHRLLGGIDPAPDLAPELLGGPAFERVCGALCRWLVERARGRQPSHSFVPPRGDG